MQYVLPNLQFSYAALEPWIDSLTMKVHHNGHHKAYVDKLNKTLADHPKWQLPIDVLISQIDRVPKEIRADVKNNAGGHANHTLFWTILTPKSQQLASGNLTAAIASNFGSFEAFREQFSEAALDHFSNGWVWLAVDANRRMIIHTTKDHDTPISEGLQPLLVLDIWEHAYYLKHQNRRAEYLFNFWHVLNWDEIEKRWDQIKTWGHTNREWQI